MARKTINVEQVREWANTRLAREDDPSLYGQYLNGLTSEQAFKLGVASLLEQILQATGNYHGFAYHASSEDVRAGNYDETSRIYKGR